MSELSPMRNNPVLFGRADSTPKVLPGSIELHRQEFENAIKRQELRRRILAGETIEVQQPEAPQPKPIPIPEGKMGAPGDHKIIPTTFSVLGSEFTVPLIFQTYAGHIENSLQGNCSEYSTVNTAIVCNELGIRINPIIHEWISQFPRRLNLDHIEHDLVIPMLQKVQDQFIRQGVVRPDRVEEIKNDLNTKKRIPTEPLDTEHALMLFHIVLAPDLQQFQPIITNSNQLSQNPTETAAYLLAGPNHQETLLRLGKTCMRINTLSRNVVSVTPLESALHTLREDMERGTIRFFYRVPVDY